MTKIKEDPRVFSKVEADPKRARNEKGHLVADDPSTPEVNEAWDPVTLDPGILIYYSNETVHMLNCSWFNPYGCDHPAWMVWKSCCVTNE